jgi:hypothetical protein
MPRAVWGGIGAVVAAAVLIAAFAQVFTHLSHTGTTTAATAATATVTETPKPITTLV